MNDSPIVQDNQAGEAEPEQTGSEQTGLEQTGQDGQASQAEESAQPGRPKRLGVRPSLGRWVVPILLGVVIGLVLALVTPLGWWLIAVGAALGALPGWVITAKSEAWVRRACGLGKTSASEYSVSTPVSHPRLHSLLESVALTTGVDVESVTILEQPQINLMAIGSRPHRADLVVTQGLASSLDRIEMEALVALALGRVRDGQVANLTSLLTNTGLWAVLSETSGSGLRRSVVRLAARFNRKRLAQALERFSDHQADHVTVGITRYPPGLIAAFNNAAELGTNVPTAPTLSVLWVIAPDEAENPYNRPSLAARIQALQHL